MRKEIFLNSAPPRMLPIQFISLVTLSDQHFTSAAGECRWKCLLGATILIAQIPPAHSQFRTQETGRFTQETSETFIGVPAAVQTWSLSRTHGHCQCKISSPWGKMELWTYAVYCNFFSSYNFLFFLSYFLVQ